MISANGDADGSGPLAYQAARNERWKQNFNELRRARGLSHQQIADRVGVTVGAVHKWAQGESRPSLDKAIALADVLDVARVRVLDWAGLVPGVGDLTLYIEQLQNHLAAAEQSRTQAPLGAVRGVALLAHALSVDGDYSFRIVPWWRGTGPRRRHVADWTVIEGGSGELSRAAIQKKINPAFVFTASYWNGPEDWSHQLDPPHPSLVICTPRFRDARRGSGVRAGTAPRNIAVMGQHWCGHAEVARFVAEALDYDFAETGFVAASVYGTLPHDFDADGWRRDRREVARTYTLDAELGRSRVWAADIWEDTDSLEIALGQARLPFVVYLRPTDRTIEYAAAMRVHCDHTQLDRDHEQTRIRSTRTLTEAHLRAADRLSSGDEPPRTLTVEVDVPDGLGPWEQIPPYAVDAWFDRYGATAATVLRGLSELGGARARDGRAFDLRRALTAARLR